MKGINSEKEFENRVRDIIKSDIISVNRELIILDNQKTTDILICKNGNNPKLFFIEIKYYDSSHGRLGFGHEKGKGFQPEILRKRPDYFQKNMRWIIGNKNNEEFLFIDNDTILKYISGGSIGYKQNNIQTKIFDEIETLKINKLRDELINWMTKS